VRLGLLREFGELIIRGWIPWHAKMRTTNAMKDEEAVDASWEASKGAMYGALKWGAATAVLGGIGYAVSPIYRGLTIQFKVYKASSKMCSRDHLKAYIGTVTFKCPG
jgi:hypothetical protein